MKTDQLNQSTAAVAHLIPEPYTNGDDGNGGLRLTVETITPDIARDYLEQNVSNNRNISDRHVAALARDIKAGRYAQNGETLKFSPEGELLDGQHRLWGCIVADKPFTTAVVRGVTSLDDVDRARPRTISNVMEIHGYPTPAKLGVVLSTTWRWENTKWRVAIIRPTSQEALIFLRQNEAELYAAQQGQAMANAEAHSIHRANQRQFVSGILQTVASGYQAKTARNKAGTGRYKDKAFWEKDFASWEQIKSGDWHV